MVGKPWTYLVFLSSRKNNKTNGSNSVEYASELFFYRRKTARREDSSKIRGGYVACARSARICFAHLGDGSA